MCLITYTPRKETIDYKKMKTAMHVNPDGFGIVYAKDGVLQYCRKPKEGYDYFVEVMKLVPDDAPVAIHFRMATHGDKGEGNQHPFPILTKEEHGLDLCLMHNGVIGSIHKNGSNKSDTLIYAENILIPLLVKYPELVSNEAFQLLVERDIGSNNKLLFLDGDGNANIYNAESGSFDLKHKEMWYSNVYSFNEYHRGGGGYNSNFTGRHHTTSQENGSGVGGNYAEHWKNRQRENNVSSTATSDIPGPLTKTEMLLKLSSDLLLETDPPPYIACLLKEGEYLVRKVDNKSIETSMGFGWITRGDNSFHWNATVSGLHRKWARERDEQALVEKALKENPPAGTPSNVTPITTKQQQQDEVQLTKDKELTKQMESKFDDTAFRQMNDSETMQWVIDYPYQAAQYMNKNGWYGSVENLVKWLNDPTKPNSIDIASDFIYKHSRGIKANIDTQKQMSLAV